MIETRPTREEILQGIGYQPLVCPEGVPAEVCEAEDRELQDYLVGWAQGAWDHVTAYEREQVKAAGLEPDRRLDRRWARASKRGIATAARWSTSTLPATSAG